MHALSMVVGMPSPGLYPTHRQTWCNTDRTHEWLSGKGIRHTIQPRSEKAAFYEQQRIQPEHTSQSLTCHQERRTTF
eukprot:scaffold73_cov337-Pavlova_lutheri.AAC.33